MKLQYVFSANPKKSVGTKKNASKIKKGGHMAKKKKNPTANQLANWARFAKDFGGNPGKKRKHAKRKSRKNAIKVKYSEDVPVKVGGVTVIGKRHGEYVKPSKKELALIAKELKKLDAGSKSFEDDYNKAASTPFGQKYLLKRLESREKAVAEAERTASLLKHLNDVDNNSPEGDVENLGELTLEQLKTFKFGRKGMKKRKNPSAPDYGMVTLANPGKRKRRKHKKSAAKKKTSKKRHSSKKKLVFPAWSLVAKKKSSHKRSSKRRKASRKLFPIVVSGKLPMGAKHRKSIGRGKKKFLGFKLSVKNPKLLNKDWFVKHGLIVLAGALYPWFNYGVKKAVVQADALSGGFISSKILGPIDAKVPGIAAPLLGAITAIGVKAAAEKSSFAEKALGKEGVKQLCDALDIVTILASGEIGRVTAAYLKVDPAGRGMSGVSFYPGFSGPDFGALGDGYKQSAGDFGGVKYFPAGMSGIEYIPEGAQGDQMYRESEANQLREAEGLGIIPAGLGDVDGIPEGMSGDEGHMG